MALVAAAVLADTSVHENYLTLGTTSFCHQIDNEAEVFQLSSYRNLSNRSNCAFFLSNPRLEFTLKGPTEKSLSEHLYIKGVQEIVNGFSWTVVIGGYPLPFHCSANSSTAADICFSVFIHDNLLPRKDTNFFLHPQELSRFIFRKSSWPYHSGRGTGRGGW